MIIGQTIVASSSAQSYFTPWFPRQEDNAVFTYEEIHSTISGAVTIDVLTKESEDSGAGGTSAASFGQLGTTDLHEAKAENLKEMVRFKINLPAESGGMLHFRFLQPTWYATAKA